MKPANHLLLSLPMCVLAGSLGAQTVLSANDVNSLRAAITTANGAGNFVINIAAGNYVLSGASLENGNADGDFDINKSSGSVTLNGVGLGTIIDGNGVDRVFHINSSGGVTVTFSNMTIRNGRAGDNGTSASQEARGGAIYAQSPTSVTVNNVVLESNSARGADGLTGAGGGGFGSSGKSALGGAIYCAGGTLTISASTISGNTAQGGRGGDGITGMNIMGTSIVTGGNGGGGGSGGSGQGGGVYLASGTMNISASTFSANSAQGGDGGDGALGGNGSASGVSFSFAKGGFGGGGGAGAQGQGGALYAVNGTVAVNNSTISGNSASAGDGGDGGDGGTGVWLGSTGSQSSQGGGGGYGGNTLAARGGGHSGVGGSFTYNNCTVASNTANAGVGGAPGMPGMGTIPPGTSSPTGQPGVAQASQGGGIYVGTSTLVLASSIVGDNAAPSGAGDDINGTATATNSLIEDLSGASVSGSGNTFADPQLAALANNGGATQTHALGANSPAIDTGANPVPLSTDQRGTGFPRQFGAGVDMGSFERQSASVPPPSIVSPASAVFVNAANYIIQGTAPAGTLVRIYSDANNDGVINGSDAVVASQQLAGGATTFSVFTLLAQDTANNFLATQFNGSAESAPVDVPTINEDSTAPAQPLVTDPAGPVNFQGPSYNVKGNAEADSLVRIYRDVNNNNMLDSGEPLLGSQQLSGGAISFDITVTLNASTQNFFLATSTDAAGNESAPADVSTITEVTLTQAQAPVITAPAMALLLNAPSYDIQGTAQQGTLVRIFEDLNNNGVVDTGEAVVGQQQLGAATTSFSITVSLTQNAPNYFVATAEGTFMTESAPADVPTITDDAGFSSGPPPGGGPSNGGGGCASDEQFSLWALLLGAIAALAAALRMRSRS